MNRLFARVATTLLVAPLAAVVAAGPAQAGSVTLPGCYGATASGIVCNPTVTYGVPLGAETYETTVPVCAGTCVDVPVTLVRTVPGQPLLVCASWVSRTGTPTSHCVDNSDVDDTVDAVEGFADGIRENTANYVDEQRYNLCYYSDVNCPTAVNNALRTVADLLRP